MIAIVIFWTRKTVKIESSSAMNISGSNQIQSVNDEHSSIQQRQKQIFYQIPKLKAMTIINTTVSMRVSMNTKNIEVIRPATNFN